jgi:hypothetical protein
LNRSALVLGVARVALGMACGLAGWAGALVVAVVMAELGYGGIAEALRGLGRSGSQRAMMAYLAACLGSVGCGLLCGTVVAARPRLAKPGWAWRRVLPGCAAALAFGAIGGMLAGGWFAGPEDMFIYSTLGLGALSATVGALAAWVFGRQATAQL